MRFSSAALLCSLVVSMGNVSLEGLEVESAESQRGTIGFGDGVPLASSLLGFCSATSQPWLPLKSGPIILTTTTEPPHAKVEALELMKSPNSVVIALCLSAFWSTMDAIANARC